MSKKKKLCLVKQEKTKIKNKNKTKHHAQGPNKSKEKSQKRKTKVASQESKATQQNPSALHMGNLVFYLLDFLPPSFLSILEKKLFGWPGEKTPGPHHLFLVSTSQPNIVQKYFPPHFLSFFFPSFLKSTLPNTLLKLLINVYLKCH